MFDVKLPQAFATLTRAIRTELLSWVADEFPMVVLRVVFILVLFGGVAVFEFQLWMAASLGEVIAVILKVGVSSVAAFAAWEIALPYIKPVQHSRFSVSSDVQVLAPTVSKRRILPGGAAVPPNDESKHLQRIRPEELSDGDIVCMEIISQDTGEHREFMSLEPPVDGVMPFTTLSLFKQWSGYKVVRSPLQDWTDNPRQWKRFCFKIHFNNGKISFKSVASNTFLFMMGIKDKTMVAWRASGSRKGEEIPMGKWERFELRACPDVPREAGTLFNLWYNFTASFIKWEHDNDRFNITNKREKAVMFALWRPKIIERSVDTTSPYQLSSKIKHALSPLDQQQSDQKERASNDGLTNRNNTISEPNSGLSTPKSRRAGAISRTPEPYSRKRV